MTQITTKDILKEAIEVTLRKSVNESVPNFGRITFNGVDWLKYFLQTELHHHEG